MSAHLPKSTLSHTMAASLPMLLPLLLLLLSAATSSASDLFTDRAALLDLRSAVGGRTLFWNTSLPTPCNWAGVLCQDNRVTVIRLPAASLFGTLPSGALSSLTSLRTLSLRLNHLSGPLPSDLSTLTQLRNLYLQGNHFSGTLPPSVFSLHSLVRLNLASNNFSAQIQPGFNNLTRLRTLFLENNHFTGPLPDFHLPNLEQFNVSFNNLSGSVPKGLFTISKDSFLGTSLCGKPLDTLCAGEDPAIAAGGIREDNNKKKLSGGAIAGIAIGSVVGLLLLLLLVFVLCRKRSGKKARSVDVAAALKHQENDSAAAQKPAAAAAEAENGDGLSATADAKSNESNAASNANAKKLVFFGSAARVFDLEELLRASAEVLGKGTFGTAYKAVLEVGTVVAVKRLKDVTISEKEFKEKIESVGGMDHQNLVPLRAYYYSREEKLLVYDYMPMGSLSALLHGQTSANLVFIYILLISFVVWNSGIQECIIV